MKRALGYAMVLLAAAATRCAHASGPDAVGVRLFFLSGAPAVRAGQGYLGVDVRDVTEDQLAALKLKEARGAEIVLVDHDAPAGKVGLREHDVILRVNGQAIEGEDQLRRMLRESSPGMQLTLLISRDGQQITVTTQTANRDEVERQAWEQHLTVPEPPPSDSAGGDFFPAPATPTPPVRGGNSFLGPTVLNPSYTGAMLETLSAQLAYFFGVPSSGGLLVRSVEANSPAALAGMHAGDVVVRANQKAVASSADWTKAIKDSHGRPLTVVVLRDKKEQTLSLTPDSKKRSSLQQPSDDSQRVALAPIGFFWLPLP
ncbi:MAG: PDZ domain-containing protein [Acidobacteriaceae bacterium]